MAYDRQQLVAPEENATNGDTAVNAAGEAVTADTTPDLNSLPPLPTETPPPPPSATPTTPICRGVVEGTFDNGLTLRDTPGGTEVDILAEAAIVTVLTEEAPVDVNNFRWIKVRTLFGDEGWVAADFLTLGNGCE
jgi:hypothetical protein